MQDSGAVPDTSTIPYGGELGSTGARCYNEATEWFRKNQP